MSNKTFQEQIEQIFAVYAPQTYNNSFTTSSLIYLLSIRIFLKFAFPLQILMRLIIKDFSVGNPLCGKLIEFAQEFKNSNVYIEAKKKILSNNFDIGLKPSELPFSCVIEMIKELGISEMLKIKAESDMEIHPYVTNLFDFYRNTRCEVHDKYNSDERLKYLKSQRQNIVDNIGKFLKLDPSYVYQKFEYEKDYSENLYKVALDCNDDRRYLCKLVMSGIFKEIYEDRERKEKELKEDVSWTKATQKQKKNRKTNARRKKTKS